MPAAQILPWPLVKRRATEIFPVRTLQQLLRARSHPVAVDGIFGPNTQTAVRNFQQRQGLPQNGVAGGQTRVLLSFVWG